MLCAEGESSSEDVIFEQRFACAEGFAALGGRVNTAGRVLHIRPGGALRGTRLSAPDLRGGAALVLAALAAQGRSQIGGVGYLDRGYAGFTEILTSLGARIYRKMPRVTPVKKHPSKPNLSCNRSKKMIRYCYIVAVI